MGEVEEETQRPTDFQIQPDAVSQLDRVKCEFREDLEHERGRCLDWLGNVNRLSSYREKDRTEFAFAQVENERSQCLLRKELGETRQDISQLRGEISKLQKRAESQHLELKYISEMLECKYFLHRKIPLLVVRPGATDVEPRLRAYLTWQFNRICVA